MTSQVRRLDGETTGAALLEGGDVLWQSGGFFEIEAREQRLFSPSVLASGKNVSFDPATGHVGGSSMTGEMAEALRSMLFRSSATRRSPSCSAPARHICGT